jgi:hypothetical protein
MVVSFSFLFDIGHFFVFHRFSRSYYCFLLAGTFLYGSMVPFWFMGAKFLQVRDGVSVERADMLVLLPGQIPREPNE